MLSPITTYLIILLWHFSINLTLCVCVCLCRIILRPSETMSTSRPSHYFIVLRKPHESFAHIQPGCICYTLRKTPATSQTRQSKKVSVYLVEALSALSYDVEVDLLLELSSDEVELLQAIRDKTERLQWLKDREALQAALLLTVDTAVSVDSEGDALQGVIRYIGRLTEPSFSCPLSGRFFGVELQVGMLFFLITYTWFTVKVPACKFVKNYTTWQLLFIFISYGQFVEMTQSDLYSVMYFSIDYFHDERLVVICYLDIDLFLFQKKALFGF